MFSLGITLYEIISGRPLPPNGEEWHRLRSGKVSMPMGLPAELSKTLNEMMHVSCWFVVEAGEGTGGRRLLLAVVCVGAVCCGGGGDSLLVGDLFVVVGDGLGCVW